MQSARLHGAIVEFVEEAAGLLHAAVLAGSEVPFELESRAARGAGPALYCYRPLTAAFIAERMPEIERRASYGAAAEQLSAFEGLDRYLASLAIDAGRAARPVRARIALRALLENVFAEQSDFELRPERVRAAIERLELACASETSGVTLVATFHGLTLSSERVALTAELEIAHPDTLQGLPEAVAAQTVPPAQAAGARLGSGHLVAVLTSDEADHRLAVSHGCEVMRDLLRALRLFGDGRVALGSLGFSRVGEGTWSPVPLGAGGRPHGMLLVTPDQEDELRAFCNLVSRRAPEGNELAWALRRFELGCDRDSTFEALSDHLLALRALLEPEGASSGKLAGRLAALCATPERRLALTERAVQALALERAVIAGTALEHAAATTLANEISDHLRALLRDVICGHLDENLTALADEILLEGARLQQPGADAGVEIALAGEPLAQRTATARAPAEVDPAGPVRVLSAEQVLGDARETQEILDLSV
jgi:hypothetical protein